MKQEKLYARHGRATDALAGINPSMMEKRETSDKALYRIHDIDVVVMNYSKQQTSIGINVHKLLTYAIIQFTSRFNEPPADKIYEVAFSIDDYIRITGGQIPADREQRRRKRNEMQKRLRRELFLLQAIRLTSTNGNDFESINIVNRVSVKNGIVTIEFFRSFAEYLLKQPKTIIHPQLLKINARSRTAYAVGLKCMEHYWMNKRRNSSAGNRLRIRNILRYSPLPDYETVAKNGKSWRERIRHPLEKALDELVAAGIFLYWHYADPAQITNFHAFENAMIIFKVAPEDKKSRDITGGL